MTLRMVTPFLVVSLRAMNASRKEKCHGRSMGSMTLMRGASEREAPVWRLRELSESEQADEERDDEYHKCDDNQRHDSRDVLDNGFNKVHNRLLSLASH